MESPLKIVMDLGGEFFLVGKVSMQTEAKFYYLKNVIFCDIAINGNNFSLFNYMKCNTGIVILHLKIDILKRHLTNADKLGMM